MNTIKYLCTIGLALFVLVQCKHNSKPASSLDKTYLENLDKRRKDLNKRRLGYLELSGLFRMTESGVIFGLNSNNQVTVDLDQIEKPIGSFEWNDENYIFLAHRKAKVSTSSGEQIKLMELPLDKFGDSEQLYYDTFSWRVITRSGGLYLRVWNKNNPAIKSFKGFKHYAANPTFIFEAEFKYFNTNKSESVESKLGINDMTTFIGQLTFHYKGKPHSLDVGENGWIMVGDQTSGKTTYGAGRYMYIELPKVNGQVLLDFNQLYNPPCRYSEFTTCLFPPRQNILPFPITAGELFAFKK